MVARRPRWLLLAAVVAACAGSPSSGGVPAPPELLVVGTLAQERIVEPQRRYLLTDGRVIEISTMTTRLVFTGGGPGQPIVHGRDEQGDFIAIFTTQQGLPADCHLPGIGQTGIERGDFIEIAGILWRKAGGFRTDEAPGLGQPYRSSTRFCFDEQAEVTSTIP